MAPWCTRADSMRSGSGSTRDYAVTRLRDCPTGQTERRDQTEGGEVFGALARTKARPGRGAGSLVPRTTTGGGIRRVANRKSCARALARNANTTEQ
jgi:hypothetical protein